MKLFTSVQMESLNTERHTRLFGLINRVVLSDVFGLYDAAAFEFE